MLNIKLINFLHIGKPLDHDQCATLLISAATGYDSQFAFASASARSTRNAHHTELGGSDF